MKNHCQVKGCQAKGTWSVWLNYAFCEQHHALGDARNGHLLRVHEGRKRGKPVRAWRWLRQRKECG